VKAWRAAAAHCFFPEAFDSAVAEYIKITYSFSYQRWSAVAGISASQRCGVVTGRHIVTGSMERAAATTMYE
jgi:hypothetical protein